MELMESSEQVRAKAFAFPPTSELSVEFFQQPMGLCLANDSCQFTQTLAFRLVNSMGFPLTPLPEYFEVGPRYVPALSTMLFQI
jgi:hypothetical protein